MKSALEMIRISMAQAGVVASSVRYLALALKRVSDNHGVDQ